MEDKPHWNRGALEALLGQQESIRLEFKSSRLTESSHEAVAKELSVEASAFANTEGGTIVVASKNAGKEGCGSRTRLTWASMPANGRRSGSSS
jgi:predicted HTH transcriptional regulator